MHSKKVKKKKNQFIHKYRKIFTKQGKKLHRNEIMNAILQKKEQEKKWKCKFGAQKNFLKQKKKEKKI